MTPAPKPKPKPSGNPLTRKVGPLPAYAWLGVVVVAFLAWRHFHAGASSGAVPTSAPVPFSGSTADTSGGGGGGGTTIPQLPLDSSSSSGASGGSAPSTPATTSPEQAAAVEQGGAPGALTQDGPASTSTTDTATVYDPSLNVPAQTYYVVPSSDGGAPTYIQPTGWFQNEQGLQKVVTPPQLAPGAIPQTGVAYAA